MREANDGKKKKKKVFNLKLHLSSRISFEEILRIHGQHNAQNRFFSFFPLSICANINMYLMASEREQSNYL